jgi:hypothetical protein
MKLWERIGSLKKMYRETEDQRVKGFVSRGLSCWKSKAGS